MPTREAGRDSRGALCRDELSSGERGDVDRGMSYSARAERVVPNGVSSGTTGSAVVPGAAAGGRRMQARQKIRAEPGSYPGGACDTSPMRGIIKSP